EPRAAHHSRRRRSRDRAPPPLAADHLRSPLPRRRLAAADHRDLPGDPRADQARGPARRARRDPRLDPGGASPRGRRRRAPVARSRGADRMRRRNGRDEVEEKSAPEVDPADEAIEAVEAVEAADDDLAGEPSSEEAPPLTAVIEAVLFAS